MCYITKERSLIKHEKYERFPQKSSKQSFSPLPTTKYNTLYWWCQILTKNIGDIMTPSFFGTNKLSEADFMCRKKRESNINSLLQKITNLSICSLFLAHTSKSQLTKTLSEIYKSDAELADERMNICTREYILIFKKNLHS